MKARHLFMKYCVRCVVLMIIALIAVFGCGGDSGSGDDDDGGDPGDNQGEDPGTDPGEDPVDPPQDPAFSGYDFTLAEGSYWEFGFEDYHRSWYLGDSNTSTDSGIFRITLGAPVIIDGITAYPLNIVPVSGDDIADTQTIRWQYIALDQGRILGSTDGSSLSVIFDAFQGSQAGGGFFASFASDVLITGTSGQIDNDYINESAVYLSQASSSGGCEYFPGIGTICPGEDREGLTVRDYFQAGVGPVGYYYRSYNTDSQGNSGAVIETNIGLISFSVEGDGFYQPPDVPLLGSGTLAVYYSLYDGPPAVVNDPFNVPTAVDPAPVLMRYLPESQTGATLTAPLSASADYGYHAMTEGDRLFIIKRTIANNTIQAVEYDPTTHTPLSMTTTTFDNISTPIHYGALTVAGDNFYFHEFDSSGGTLPAPWTDNYAIYIQGVGSSSSYAPGDSVGFNHLLSDGSSNHGPFAAYINPNSEGLCPADNHLYYFQRLEINGGIDAVNLSGACQSDDYFSDLTQLVHSFAIDSGGLYIGRSAGEAIEVYRTDRSSTIVQSLYWNFFLDQRRALLIDVSNGYVLLHSYDRDNVEDYEVVLLNTQNTSSTADDTEEILDLPGTGIPMHLQLLEIP
jgi:hypothetical protein